MSNEHVSAWTAFVYMVHVAMFPRGSACVYIVHVVKTSIRNYFAKTRHVLASSIHRAVSYTTCSSLSARLIMFIRLAGEQLVRTYPTPFGGKISA